MMNNSHKTLPQRKPNRLKGFDYSQNGMYFVTICTHNRKCILSQIIVGDGVLDVPHTMLSNCGKIADKYINQLNDFYFNIKIEKYVIMPNHIHLLIYVDNPDGMSRTPSPTNAYIPQFISTLKRFCNKEIGYNIFQRSFHDHIVRNEADYEKIYNYIENNPSKWTEDCFYIE